MQHRLLSELIVNENLLSFVAKYHISRNQVCHQVITMKTTHRWLHKLPWNEKALHQWIIQVNLVILHLDTKYNYLCFSYKLRIRKRGSDRKWWNEQEKRNTGGVLSPTTLSTLVGKSQLVNLSLQRQRFRSVQENQFAHRFETWNKEKDTKRWWQFQKALKIPVTFQRRHTIHSFLLYPPLYRI